MQKKFLTGVILAFLMLPASAGIQENLYYNNLNSMLRASTAQNGSVAQWNWQKGEDSVFDQYLEPSLTILKECEKTDKSCWQNSYIGLNNKPAPVPSGSHKSYVLSNGASIIFEIKDPNCAKNNETCAYIWVTPMETKSRMLWGDMFKFYIHSNANVIYPVGYSYKTGANKQGIEKSCNSMASGFYCGARLLVEKTMAY
jgi:hypothetical protein